MEKLKRIQGEDRNDPKKVGILELYTAVQSEGSRAGYPTIVIRTTGCTHRCYFGEGGWCDSWYTSIHPEKSLYTFNDVVKMYDENPHIKEMMITGGSPTMWPALVNELTHFAYERNIFTTIETEGSHPLKTDYPIDLISLSPKFSNSVPIIGTTTPTGKVTDERMVKQHNKFRLNVETIAELLNNHNDFHIKPVFDKDLSILEEFEEFLVNLSKEIYKQGYFTNWLDCTEEDFILTYLKMSTWVMPAGDDRESLFESYPVIMNFCRDSGYKFTGRAHIMAFNDMREV